MNYRVENLEDDVWQVIEYYLNQDTCEYEFTVYYQGSLSDCEAYIRLEENGYLL